MNTPVTSKPELTTFYIIDFDRTLADSDKLLDVFLGVVSHYLELPREEIEKADADVKARGDSFDTASYVRDQLNKQGEGERWNELEKQFIHESRALNMLLPGASELLEALTEGKQRFGILTYGNPLWQRLKLTAAGFNHIRRIILEQKEKGKLVASWQQTDGAFRLPQEYGGGIVDRIIMIDDKAVSFDGFPMEPSHGYHVYNPDQYLLSQQGKVPTNVETSHSLADVLQRVMHNRSV